MILTVPLADGTALANVVYRWIAAGAVGSETSSGVTQPWATVPLFRIDSDPPIDAEEMVVYDSINATNYQFAGYRKGLQAVATAQQILLVNLWPGGAGPATIVPAAAASLSICRCFGTFYNLSALGADGLDVTFTLVQVDATDPTIIYDMSSTLIRNKETNQLVTDRVVTASIVAGQLQDSLGNAYVDLVRTDYMQDSAGVALPRMRYLLQSESLGAKFGLSLSTDTSPVFSPVTFVLDGTTLAGLTAKGTFDISKLKPS